jgi:pimeloyl-ACP methyl ester carboxylesterase/DNA-binding CsgD family transcriptional regulator
VPPAQGIRFVEWSGRRVAVDVAGDGPVLVAPAWWVSHLEADAAEPRYAAFWRQLAEGFTLVRYDRAGVGLSDRDVRPSDFTLDAELECLRTVLDRLGVERATLLGGSSGGCTALAFAAREPERVERLVLYGAYARGADVAAAEVRAAVVAAVRSHWGLGSRLLAQIFLGADAEVAHERFARLQRASADGETAARLLELVYAVDVSAELAAVACPVTVVHRRSDRAVPYAVGRRLAAALPAATFVPVAGSAHLPWYEDAAAVVRACRRGLGDAPPPAADDVAALSEREREVLALVASGLTDPEIAEQLVLSSHTVHRHVANVRRKLGATSRSAAVAEAVRLGLL